MSKRKGCYCCDLITFCFIIGCVCTTAALTCFVGALMIFNQISVKISQDTQEIKDYDVFGTDDLRNFVHLKQRKIVRYVLIVPQPLFH